MCFITAIIFLIIIKKARGNKLINMNDKIPKNMRKLAQIVTSIYFLRQCRQHDIIPNGLRAKNVLEYTLNCEQAVKLCLKHSKQWLKLTLNIYYQRLDKIICNKMFPLTEELQMKYNSFLDKLYAIKKSKIVKLLNKMDNNNENLELNTPWGIFQVSNETKINKSPFINTTNIEVPNNISEILDNGPSYTPKIGNNFNFGKQKIEFMADVNKAVQQLSNSKVSQAKLYQFNGMTMEICNEMEIIVQDRNKKGKKDKIKLFEDNKIIKDTKDFLKNNNLNLIKTDKTNRMLLMENNSYQEMLRETTINTDNFDKIKSVQPKTNPNKI